jgi:hypothetical protein
VLTIYKPIAFLKPFRRSLPKPNHYSFIDKTIFSTMTKMLNLIRLTTFTTMPSGRKLQKGDQLRYDFQIENISDSIISNICINKEGEEAQMEGISISPGLSHTISKTYFLTKEDERAGIIRNISILSGQIPTGEIITETLTGLNEIK